MRIVAFSLALLFLLAGAAYAVHQAQNSGEFVIGGVTTTTIPVPPAPVRAGAIEVDVEYEFVKNGVVPLIPPGGECTSPRGCPDFAKTMPIRFSAKGVIRGLVSGKCTEAKCAASYEFDNGPAAAMTWDPFSSSFVAERGSRDLACGYHTLAVAMITTDGSKSGSANEKIRISCEERITLNPAERRLALGEKNKLGFLLNVWNPTDFTKAYNIEIRPQSDQGFVASWLSFDCGSVAQCSVSSNILSITVPAVDSREVQVMLTNEASSRSGIYPVNFADSGGLQGKGTLLVFAEGLSEFAAWQMLALVLFASVIFAVLK